MRFFFTFWVTLLICIPSLYAQNCSSLNLQHQSDITHTCGTQTMSMEFDQMGRDYLYVANKEAGLRIYDISNYSSPLSVDTVSITQLSGLQVMNVNQYGNYVYLSLGNHFSNAKQRSGLAIVDVSDPTNVVLTDVWVHQGPVAGGGIVQVEGNYAYFGAMGNGLFVLDISDKNQIDSVSHFIPDLSYPTPNPDTPKYNARGLVVQDDLVYLCFDAGGVRVIDVTDKQNPVEIGAYSNPFLNGKPRAYNNLVLDDTLLYVATDYCGMEVMNVSDPANITLHAWWNPWGCNNWFTSRGHTNEIEIDTVCEKVFLSTGKSDVYVVDITDPSAPDSCDAYGTITDTLGTWGVARRDNRVALSYICTLGIPFTSFYSGVKLLTYNNQCTTGLEGKNASNIRIYPNPTSGWLQMDSAENIQQVILINLHGDVVLRGHSDLLDLSGISDGVYLVQVETKEGVIVERVVKM